MRAKISIFQNYDLEFTKQWSKADQMAEWWAKFEENP